MYGLRNSELSTFNSVIKRVKQCCCTLILLPKSTLNANLTTTNRYEWRLTARTIQKFRIGPSIQKQYKSNLESDVRFEIESNHEASQVPNTTVLWRERWDECCVLTECRSSRSELMRCSNSTSWHWRSARSSLRLERVLVSSCCRHVILVSWSLTTDSCRVITCLSFSLVNIASFTVNSPTTISTQSLLHSTAEAENVTPVCLTSVCLSVTSVHSGEVQNFYATFCGMLQQADSSIITPITVNALELHYVMTDVNFSWIKSSRSDSVAPPRAYNSWSRPWISISSCVSFAAIN